MSGQDILINRTLEAVDGIIKAVRAMPEDKLNWKPMEEGKSAMEQLKEVTRACVWFALMAEAKAEPEWGDEQRAKQLKMSDGWKSIDDVERALREQTNKLCNAIESCSDADLKLPFKFEGVEKDYTLGEALNFHQSHTMYHIGQINYIQTLYGDKTNHWF